MQNHESDSRARIFVREVRTGLFFKAPGEWVARSQDPHTFATGLEAQVIQLSCKQDTEIYFSFSDPAYDFTIPVTPHAPQLNP